MRSIDAEMNANTSKMRHIVQHKIQLVTIFLNIFCEVTKQIRPAASMITSKRMKGVLLTIVAPFASTQGQCNIRSKRFYSFFGCKGNA